MFSVPSNSPLSRGWRKTLATMLTRHGLHAVQDAISDYAELRGRLGELPRNLPRTEKMRSLRDLAILDAATNHILSFSRAARRRMRERQEADAQAGA
jgi:hypothetical protein